MKPASERAFFFAENTANEVGISLIALERKFSTLKTDSGTLRGLMCRRRKSESTCIRNTKSIP